MTFRNDGRGPTDRADRIESDREVQLNETIGGTNPQGCLTPEFSIDFPTVLHPHETRYFCMPFEDLGAFTFTSSRPILTNCQIVHSRKAGAQVIQTFQSIETGHAWIKPGQNATIHGARQRAGVARTNLTLVNPNVNELTVSYTTIRTATTGVEDGIYLPVRG